LSRASVNQKISALSSFFQFVQARYVFRTPDGREVALWPADRANPFGAVERAEIDVYARAQYPSTEEVQAILGAINTETERGARDFALLYTFAVTCRRAREILSLRWGQIEPAADKHWKFKYVYKGGKTKVAPLQNDVYQAMVHYLKKVGRYPLKADELVFVTLDGERAGRVLDSGVLDCDPAQANRAITNGQANRMLKVYARRAGVDERKAHLHALRHAGARQRYQSAKQAGNADLLEISQFLGHSSVAVTQIYAGQVLDDPGDPAGAAAAAAFKPKRKRGRPRKDQAEQLFDPKSVDRRR
jgi:integrase